jgi:hypothetical protein
MTFERHKMNKRVVQDLKKRSTIGIPFYILLSLIVVFAANLHERHLFFSMFFLLSMGGICLFRLIHLAVSRKMGERYETLNKNIFFASVIVTALIWGVTYALIMLQEGEYIIQMLMIRVCLRSLRGRRGCFYSKQAAFHFFQYINTDAGHYYHVGEWIKYTSCRDDFFIFGLHGSYRLQRKPGVLGCS